MRKMGRFVARSTMLLGILYGSYWFYLHYFPDYYNSATNNRWYFMKTILEEPRTYAQQPLLFIGDSRLNAGVEFAQIDSCFSLSAGGISPIGMYFMLKNYLGTYPAPERVVLSQSPRFFMETFSFWGFGVRNRFFSTDDLHLIFEDAQRLKDPLLGKYPKLRHWLYKMKYFEYYQPDLRASRICFGKKRNRKMTEYMIANKGKRPHRLIYNSHSGHNYETGYASFNASPLLDLYFEKLLKLCAENSIEVSFINMPMNKSSFDKLSPIFISDFEEYLMQKERDFPGAKFDNLLYAWPDSMFGDPSHLHKKGAAEFTKKLKERL